MEESSEQFDDTAQGTQVSEASSPILAELHGLALGLRSHYVAFQPVWKTLLNDAAKKFKARREFMDSRIGAQNQGRAAGEEDGSVSVKLRPGELGLWRKLESEFSAAHNARQFVAQSFIVSLFARFDQFLGNLYALALSSNPQALGSVDHKFSFSDLVRLGSVDDARQEVLDKEIADFLFKSRVDQVRRLEEVADIRLKDRVRTWGEFEVLALKRNLIVHNGGVVNQKFLEVCARNEVDTSLAVGDAINVDSESFRNAYRVVLHTGLVIGSLLLRKTETDQDPNRLTDWLNSIALELIEQEEYPAAIEFLEFLASKQMLKDLGEEIQLYIQLNLAQALKWNGQEEEAQKVLAATNWEVRGPLYRLARMSLSDDLDVALGLVAPTVELKEIALEALLTWPIFRNLRRHELFQQTIAELFPKLIEVETQIGDTDGESDSRAAEVREELGINSVNN